MMKKIEVLSAFYAFISLTRGDDVLEVPNSCRDLPDGLHTLKLLDGDYPLVTVQCSNGYMMIDVNQDSDLESYFSSVAMWHYAIMGPVNDDHVNWHDWFLPSSVAPYSTDEDNNNNNNDDHTVTGNDEFEFLYSQECQVCDLDSIIGHFAGTTQLPYMSGNLYGCFWPIRGVHDYDMDWDTYECYYQACDDTKVGGSPCSKTLSSEITPTELEELTSAQTGLCATLPQSPTFSVATDHHVCVVLCFVVFYFVYPCAETFCISCFFGRFRVFPLIFWIFLFISLFVFFSLFDQECADAKNQNYYKPSLGTDGRNCVCVKPSAKYSTKYEISQSLLDTKTQTMEEQAQKQALEAKSGSGSSLQKDSQTNRMVLSKWNISYH